MTSTTNFCFKKDVSLLNSQPFTFNDYQDHAAASDNASPLPHFVPSVDALRRCACRLLSFAAATQRLPQPSVLCTSSLEEADAWAQKHVIDPYRKRILAAQTATHNADLSCYNLTAALKSEIDVLEGSRKNLKNSNDLDSWHSLVESLKKTLESSTSGVPKSPCPVTVRFAVGFDTETKNDKANVSTSCPTSVLQLATPESVLVLQLSPEGREPLSFPKSSPLREVIESPDIFKVGIAVESDADCLEREYNLLLRSPIEFQTLTRGFNELCKKFLHFNVAKNEVLWLRLSNWNSENLDVDAISYAATDAWIPLITYYKTTHPYLSENYPSYFDWISDSRIDSSLHVLRRACNTVLFFASTLSSDENLPPLLARAVSVLHNKQKLGVGVSRILNIANLLTASDQKINHEIQDTQVLQMKLNKLPSVDTCPVSIDDLIFDITGIQSTQSLTQMPLILWPCECSDLIPEDDWAIKWSCGTSDLTINKWLSFSLEKQHSAVFGDDLYNSRPSRRLSPSTHSSSSVVSIGPIDESERERLKKKMAEIKIPGSNASLIISSQSRLDRKPIIIKKPSPNRPRFIPPKSQSIVIKPLSHCSVKAPSISSSSSSSFESTSQSSSSHDEPLCFEFTDDNKSPHQLSVKGCPEEPSQEVPLKRRLTTNKVCALNLTAPPIDKAETSKRSYGCKELFRKSVKDICSSRPPTELLCPKCTNWCAFSCSKCMGQYRIISEEEYRELLRYKPGFEGPLNWASPKAGPTQFEVCCNAQAAALRESKNQSTLATSTLSSPRRSPQIGSRRASPNKKQRSKQLAPLSCTSSLSSRSFSLSASDDDPTVSDTYPSSPPNRPQRQKKLSKLGPRSRQMMGSPVVNPSNSRSDNNVSSILGSNNERGWGQVNGALKQKGHGYNSPRRPRNDFNRRTNNRNDSVAPTENGNFNARPNFSQRDSNYQYNQFQRGPSDPSNEDGRKQDDNFGPSRKFSLIGQRNFNSKKNRRNSRPGTNLSNNNNGGGNRGGAGKFSQNNSNNNYSNNNNSNHGRRTPPFRSGNQGKWGRGG